MDYSPIIAVIILSGGGVFILDRLLVNNHIFPFWRRHKVKKVNKQHIP